MTGQFPPHPSFQQFPPAPCRNFQFILVTPTHHPAGVLLWDWVWAARQQYWGQCYNHFNHCSLPHQPSPATFQSITTSHMAHVADRTAIGHWSAITINIRTAFDTNPSALTTVLTTVQTAIPICNVIIRYGHMVLYSSS